MNENPTDDRRVNNKNMTYLTDGGPLAVAEQNRKRRVFSDETVEKYTSGGMEPMPEADIEVDRMLYQDQTLDELLRFELPFSYFNHRLVWNEYNKATVLKPSNVLKRAAGDLKRWARYKTGGSPAAISLPDSKCRNCQEVFVNIEIEPTCPKCDSHDIGKPHSGPALIIGSGVSLEKALPLLKDWKGGIICSTSHGSTLMYHGCTPKHVLAFDHRVDASEFRIKGRWPRESILITHPGIDPEVNASWSRGKYYYRVMEPHVPFYTQSLSAGYAHIEAVHYPFGHSAPAMMTFANRLGYGPLILVGVDLAYQGQKRRYIDWYYEDHKWQQTKIASIDETKHAHLLVKTMSGHITNWSFLTYRESVVAAAWLDSPTVIDASEGILTGLWPHMDIGDVIAAPEGHFDGKIQDEQTIRDRLEPWLALAGFWWIPFEAPDGTGGFKLIRVTDWKTQMKPHLALIEHRTGQKRDLDAQMEHCQNMIDKAEATDYGDSRPMQL